MSHGLLTCSLLLNCSSCSSPFDVTSDTVMSNLACRSVISSLCWRIYLSSFIQSHSPWFSALLWTHWPWLAFAYSIPFPYGSEVKNPSAMQETQEIRVQSHSRLGRSLGGGGSSNHSSLLAWWVPWAAEPGHGWARTHPFFPCTPRLPPLHPCGPELQSHFLSHVKTCSLCMLVRPPIFPSQHQSQLPLL